MFQSLVGSGVYCDVIYESLNLLIVVSIPSREWSLLRLRWETMNNIINKFQSLVGSGVYCDLINISFDYVTSKFQSLVGSGVYCDYYPLRSG